MFCLVIYNEIMLLWEGAKACLLITGMNFQAHSKSLRRENVEKNISNRFPWTIGKSVK